MLDQYGRTIEYMRISITDRCNMRCLYCMPDGIVTSTREDLLTYEEILKLCRIAVTLGIVKFKITGGEPLVRRGCIEFIRRLKNTPGVKQVTMTTNGLLLDENLDELARIGIDGINVSIDSCNEERYKKLTGVNTASAGAVTAAVCRGVGLGIKMKVNSVLLEEMKDDITVLASLAEDYPVDVRFIELMPIGRGSMLNGIEMEEAMNLLRERWNNLKSVNIKRGNGPAHYYSASELKGHIGFISAISHKFCFDCNRVRLTSEGILKPCLCYEKGVDFRSLLRGGAEDEVIRTKLKSCVYGKPGFHSFLEHENITEHKNMYQIGG